ncbi:MAG: DinB family protein [Chloroflexota bacterium]
MKTVSELLDLMDSQRQSTFAALDGLTVAQLWEKPAPREWSIGEILDHNNRLYETFFPLAKAMWRWLRWYGQWKRNRPYEVEIEDIYRRPSFPHWVGFLWPPKHTPKKPVTPAALRSETEAFHADIRAFYSEKDPDVLGNLYLYDPVFGWCNLIVTLRVGIHHDRLHYEDALKQARAYSLPADSANRGVGASKIPPP